MHLLDKVFAYFHRAMFNLPLIGSNLYQQRLGCGVLADMFEDACGLMDGHEIRVHPPTQQREYYDGRKGYHCVNFLFLHDGNGEAIYIHGGIPGRENDITLLRGSSFYQNIHLNTSMHQEHVWLADGAWKDTGLPFLTGFTDRIALNVFETVFNYLHAERRVLA